MMLKENKIVLMKRRKDSLIELLESPAHADPAKIKQINLKILVERALDDIRKPLVDLNIFIFAQL